MAWLALLVLATAAGAGLVRRLAAPSLAWPQRLAAGAALGQVLLGLALLVAASVLGPGPLAWWTAGLSLVPAAALLLRALPPGATPPAAPAPLAEPLARPGRWDAVGIALAALLLGLVFGRVLLESPRGIATGVEHDLGDLPFHLAVVTSFERGENLPPEHPELSGARLTYPFLVDLAAAALVRAGASLRLAFLAQNLLLALAFVVLLQAFARELTGDALAARLAPWLVLLSGGLGFAWLLGDLEATGPAALLRLSRDYTITRDGTLRWGNALLTLLVPQRSLLLGAPLALAAFTLLLRALREPDERPAARLALGAGVVVGLLPLAHAHAFATLLGTSVLLAIVCRRLGVWRAFFLAALSLGLPQVIWLAQGSSLSAGRFLAWQPGWDAGGRNPLAFWAVNAGLFIPLWLIGLARMQGLARRFSLVCALLFVVPNLLRLSPWIWDNVKFLFFWLLCAAPLAALPVAALWRAGGLARRAAAIGLVVATTLSGAIDVFRVVSRQIELPIFDASGLAIADQIARLTPPRSLVLHAATYDSPVYLSGRRSLLGYPGHIWSQGLTSGEREAEIARIYSGAADALDLLRRHQIDVLLVGPQERRVLRVNDAFLSRFPVLASEGLRPAGRSLISQKGLALRPVAAGWAAPGFTPPRDAARRIVLRRKISGRAAPLASARTLWRIRCVGMRASDALVSVTHAAALRLKPAAVGLSSVAGGR
jgi:hypothetical protein